MGHDVWPREAHAGKRSVARAPDEENSRRIGARGRDARTARRRPRRQAQRHLDLHSNPDADDARDAPRPRLIFWNQPTVWRNHAQRLERHSLAGNRHARHSHRANNSNQSNWADCANRAAAERLCRYLPLKNFEVRVDKVAPNIEGDKSKPTSRFATARLGNNSSMAR
jgi:hypothetical protein